MVNTTPLVWLIGNEGTPDEIRFELTGSETTLGRGSDCEIQVDDNLVSRRHAIIHFRDGGFQIEDLNSSNGTFVNDKRVTSQPLLENDIIQIGNTFLRVCLEQDADQTVIQMRLPPQTDSTSSLTTPRVPGAVPCRQCRQANPKGGKFCFECGAALPQLPESFRKTQEIFTDTQTSYNAGQLTSEEYQAALTKLVVQDNDGDYWMLGVDSGDWYWYDGEEWNLRTPSLVLPEEEQPIQSITPAPQQPEQLEAIPPTQTKGGRWGVIGLWFISALFVLAFGVYAVVEIVSFSRGRSVSQLASISPGVAEEGLDSIDSAAEESPFPTDSAAPIGSAPETWSGFNLRSYDPSTDGSLLSLTVEAEYMPDLSSEENFIYEGQFPADTPGTLVMGWCAIDQATLEGNMAVIEMVGTFDGTAIPQNMWTWEDTQQDGMFCRFYRTVVEDLETGIHHYLWSTSYEDPIFDGWETYQPGTYTKDYVIEIEERYEFVDEFESSAGHWGETEREEVKIWIEGGNLHIELYTEAIGTYSHFRDREFDDFTFVTQVQSVSEYPGYYGIVFRQQDVDNYYFFQVTDEGSFRLGKRVGETIDLIPWTPSEAILRDGGVNRLAVSMEGDWILALINGELVADLHDGSLKDGNLCLMAFTPEGVGGSHIIFQQVSIEAPE